MGAAKASNSKDTYLATAVTFIVIGALYLIDKLIHFSTLGLPWVMNKDNMLLYASICFLIFKRDKSIGFVLLGLWLIDKLIHFSTLGLPWVMNKDNMLLYASICFLIFKRDKSIGFVLLGLWLVMNISLVISLLGSLSGYLLPLTLLIVGIILFWFAKR